jgi:hypothetical protein
MKYLVLLAFVAIIGSLASALFFMMKDGQDGKPKTNNMARDSRSCCSCASWWPGSSAISSRPASRSESSRGRKRGPSLLFSGERYSQYTSV